MIIGTAVGSLLLIFVLVVFLAILYWKLSNRHGYEKEFSNEIRYCIAPYTQHDTVNGFSGFTVGKLSCCNAGNKSKQPGNFLPVFHYHKKLPAAFVHLKLIWIYVKGTGCLIKHHCVQGFLLSIGKTFFGFHTEKHKTGGREKDNDQTLGDRKAIINGQQDKSKQRTTKPFR